MKPGVVIVIPARYASKRFPGKVLALLDGRPMLSHVIDRARASAFGHNLVVATDDRRILEVARQAGVDARLTRAAHPSGTDRVAEIAEQVDEEIFLNLQADEPLISPNALDRCVRALIGDPEAGMSTLAHPIDWEAAQDPNAVKVVVDARQHALYFSRAPIPFGRGEGDSPLLRHVGIYCYRRPVLLELARAAPSPLERAERLEQLRALERGVSIRVEVVDWCSSGVDTPDDLRRAEALLRGS